MRDLTDRDKMTRFMLLFGRAARSECRVYFTGGCTAVLMGWRASTVDVDLKFEPESDELFRALQDIKESLSINIELVSPPDFIPSVPGWEDRCVYIGREGKASFFHYDIYSQALAKIERGHEQDIEDVQSMLADRLIGREKLLSLFLEIKPSLYRYPALEENVFETKVREITDH